MKVLGAYKFTDVESSDEDCGCGADYCNILQIGDRITFQIPEDETCCGDSQSYTNGEEMEDDFTIASGSIDHTATPTNLCFSNFNPISNKIFYKSDEFVSGNTYKICVCITGLNPNVSLNVFIGAVEGDAILEDGNYCFDITAGASGSLDWGINAYSDIATEGQTFCLGCINLCVIKTYSITLRDSDGMQVDVVSSSLQPNGNRAVNFLLSNELTGGCYYLQVENDCDEIVLQSNCINIRATFDCSILLKYSNRNNAFGFDYSNPSYVNYLRVNARLKNPSYPSTTAIYQLSNNNNIIANSTVQKTQQLSVEDIPEYVHDALAVAIRHSSFLVNGVNYVAQDGDYAPNWRNSSDKAPVIIEVFAQDFDGVGTYCG